MNEENYSDREFSHHLWGRITKGKGKPPYGWIRGLAVAAEVSDSTASLWWASLRTPGRSKWPAISRYIGRPVEDFTRKKVKK